MKSITIIELNSNIFDYFMSFSFFGMKGAYKPQQLCYVKSLFLSVHAMNVSRIKYYTTMIQDELQKKGC